MSKFDTTLSNSCEILSKSRTFKASSNGTNILDILSLLSSHDIVDLDYYTGIQYILHRLTADISLALLLHN